MSSTHIRGLDRRRRRSLAPAGCLGAPFELRGDGDARRQARARRSASRPRTWCRIRRSSTRATGSTPAARPWRSTASGAGRRPRRASACGRPSSPASGVLVEAFLLDFDGDLYGRELRLAFLQHLRGEQRFDSVDAPDRADGARRRGDAPYRGLTGAVGLLASAASLRVRAGTRPPVRVVPRPWLCDHPPAPEPHAARRRAPGDRGGRRWSGAGAAAASCTRTCCSLRWRCATATRSRSCSSSVKSRPRDLPDRRRPDRLRASCRWILARSRAAGRGARLPASSR